MREAEKMTKHVSPPLIQLKNGRYHVLNKWSFPTLALAMDAAEQVARGQPEARGELMARLKDLVAKLTDEEKVEFLKSMSQGADRDDVPLEAHNAGPDGHDGDAPVYPNIESGPLGPHSHEPPVATTRDQMPRNAREGGLGGRTEIGMDAILRDAGRRFAAGRGEGFSVGRFPQQMQEPVAYDSAGEADLCAMFPGASRIQRV
jgi:hypothetical protein